MIIIMHPEATPHEIDNVVAEVEAKGWQTHRSCDSGQAIIGLQGEGQPIDPFHLGQMPGRARPVAISHRAPMTGSWRGRSASACHLPTTGELGTDAYVGTATNPAGTTGFTSIKPTARHLRARST